MRRVAIFFDRLGPYHLARLNGALVVMSIHGIEVKRRDSLYAWDTVDGVTDFTRNTLFNEDKEIPRYFQLSKVLANLLEEIRPEVIVVPGWSSPASLAALEWSRTNSVPAVLMSESNAADANRNSVVEYLKSRVVRQFSTALVGGNSHRAYLSELGLPVGRCFLGYDAIDNDYFSNSASSVRREAEVLRHRLALPERYFLASCRFIPKKNLTRLLDAFALYRARFGDRAWDLVLLGDGPCAAPIRQQVSQLGIVSCVHLPGFKQYDELPKYYALARAFVHASTVEQWGLVVNEAMASGLPVLVSRTCGCAGELVREGCNGWTFDPMSVDAICDCLIKVHERDAYVEVMGQASQEIIADWGPKRFASGLLNAVESALASGLPARRIGDIAVLRMLGSRLKRSCE